jgi:diacylglycerol kinase family enzyme
MRGHWREPVAVDRRMLLIVNRVSGTGCRPPVVTDLVRGLAGSGGGAGLEVALVDDHPSARRAASSFLAASDRPAAIVAGGGGGTLRAAVEGVCDVAPARLPDASQLVLGVLRMGSGNLIARRLGMAADPVAGARQLAGALSAGSVTPCAVMRCRSGMAGGGDDVRHAVLMCGLGQFGRTSGDLARWHARLPEPRRALAALVGLERLNDLEYVASAAGRFAAATLDRDVTEEVEVAIDGRRERFRLLAGAVMNMRVGAIPFDPGVAMGEPAAGVLLLPRGGRLRTWRLAAGDELRVTLLDRESVEFFLDEDPERAHREIAVGIRGTLSFLRATREEAA